MPKRYRDVCDKRRKKSVVPDDSSQVLVERDKDVTKNDVFTEQRNNYKQLNQIERLLLHNSFDILQLVDHSNIPSFNVGLWPQECNETLKSFPSCAFSTPRPLFIAKEHGANFDVCYMRPMHREGYRRCMKHTRSAYQSAVKSNKNIRSSIKNGVYPSLVFDMAERKYTDRDPYFHSSYDYYFTGGNLCLSNDNRSVIHAGGETLQELVASEFPAVDEYNNSGYLHQIASLKMSDNCEILEINPFITAPGSSRHNCFITRQRNLLTLNCLTDNNKLKSVTHFRTKSTPFISFAQSKHNINNFVVTTMKQHVRLYDVSEKVPALVERFEISPKSDNTSWNTVKPWRENTFMYANEKQFFMIDIRTSPQQWLSEITFVADSILCEHISAVLPSNFKNLFYIATSHKLKCMDIRRLKTYASNNTDGLICEWSHQLQYAPLMMDTFRLLQDEIIALSSPIPGDLHICQLSRQRSADNQNLESDLYVRKHNYNAQNLPYQPPTLFEAYESARLSGKCLRPESNLKARIKFATTGMKFCNLSSTPNNSECGVGLLMTLNSKGDIFAHTLNKREQQEADERCNRQSDEKMAEFEQKIIEQTQPTLNYTEIKGMKGLRKVFLCAKLSSVKEYDSDDMEETDATTNLSKKCPKRLHLGRWQKSISTLHSYKDALVSDLLSIWDIDIEEEQKIRLGDLRNSVQSGPQAKVETWLKQHVNSGPPAMLSIPSQEISRYTENDNSHIFDSTITFTHNTTINFENVIHSTQIFDNSNNISANLDTSAAVTQMNVTSTTVDKCKNKKKNKKYIKGF